MAFLPDIIEDIHRTFAEQAHGAGIRVSMADMHPKSGFELECDPVRIRGALSNFTSNAMKWIMPEGRVAHRFDGSQPSTTT